MRTFGATIKEKEGAVVNPTYMADDDFWKWNEPKPFLINFWGLENADVEDYTLYEIVNGDRKEL